MYGFADETLANAIDQYLKRILDGTDKVDGLSRTILAVSSWDEFNRQRGMIQAYENVRRELQEIVRRMNSDER